jgi:hypothetical protein
MISTTMLACAVHIVVVTALVLVLVVVVEVIVEIGVVSRLSRLLVVLKCCSRLSENIYRKIYYGKRRHLPQWASCM